MFEWLKKKPAAAPAPESDPGSVGAMRGGEVYAGAPLPAGSLHQAVRHINRVVTLYQAIARAREPVRRASLQGELRRRKAALIAGGYEAGETREDAEALASRLNARWHKEA